MWNALCIFVGGGLGSLARWGISEWMAIEAGRTFPWGTLTVNVTGSFAIGLFAALAGPDGRWPAPESAQMFFTLGICGGYTTFSSFSLQTLHMAQQGDLLKAAAYILASFVLCVAGVWVGHAAGVQFATWRT